MNCYCGESSRRCRRLESCCGYGRRGRLAPPPTAACPPSAKRMHPFSSVEKRSWKGCTGPCSASHWSQSWSVPPGRERPQPFTPDYFPACGKQGTGQLPAVVLAAIPFNRWRQPCCPCWNQTSTRPNVWRRFPTWLRYCRRGMGPWSGLWNVFWRSSLARAACSSGWTSSKSSTPCAGTRTGSAVSWTPF